MADLWNPEALQAHVSQVANTYQHDYLPFKIAVVIFILMALALAGHAFLRFILTPKKDKSGLAEVKNYLYPIHLRIWHWSNASLFVALLVSGLVNHLAIGPYTLKSDLLVFHKICGFLLLFAWIGFLLINLIGGNGHHYLIRFKGYIARCIKQARFYLYGIFKGEPHPFHSTKESKFNPLQQVAYLGVMYGLVPLLLITGFLIQYPALQSVIPQYWLLMLHFILAIVSLLFMVAHMYLCTMGDSVTQTFHAMVDGYHRHLADKNAPHHD